MGGRGLSRQRLMVGPREFPHVHAEFCRPRCLLAAWGGGCWVASSQRGCFPVARRDVFDEAYGRGVTRAVRRPPRSAVPRVRDVPLDAGAALPGGLVSGGSGSEESTAFGGSVLKSDGSIARGWVVVEAGQIVSVRSTKPRDVEHAISTGGVILPGLIDLHGHPEYNVFAAWEPPGVYINRGRMGVGFRATGTPWAIGHRHRLARWRK